MKLPDEPVDLPPSAVGAVRELVEWFRHELAAARERGEILAAGKHAAERRAHHEEQRADRAERRIADGCSCAARVEGVGSEPSGDSSAEREGEP